MPTPPPPIRRTSPATYQERLVHQAGAPIKRAIRTGPPPLSRRACRLSGGLLLLGAALTVVGLFPTYLQGGGSMSAHTARWLFEAIPLVAWVIGGGLVAPGRLDPARAGVAIASGCLIITSGLNLSSVLQLAVASGATSSPGFGAARAGFWLIIAGDAVAVLGALAALAAVRRTGGTRVPVLRRRVFLGMSGILGAALVVGYLPGWRHYRLVARSIKHADSLTTASPFAGAWEVIAAEVLVVVGLGLVPLVASQWEHLRATAAAFWGVALGIGGLLTLNAVEAATATPETFLRRSEVESLHVRLTTSMTLGFWLEVSAVAVLLLAGVILGARPAGPGASAPDERLRG